MEEPKLLTRFSFGKMDALIYASEEDLARAAALNTVAVLRRVVRKKGIARIILATGNSQLGFVEALASEKGVPWSQVTVFHMDEYVGLTSDHSASFVRWIRERVELPLHPGNVHYLGGNEHPPERECERYEKLLREASLDLVCMGIGENGHIAFNEPGAANFFDDKWVRIVKLDGASRRQQLHEGHFSRLDDVPVRAMSLTVPALLSAGSVQVVVPERRKAEAVRRAALEPVDNSCPATALRLYSRAQLFLEPESASKLLSGSE